MTAKHPPEANPNRGYSYVGQESVSSISGFEKGLPQGKSIRDIKVSAFYMIRCEYPFHSNKHRKLSIWAPHMTASLTTSG